MPAIPKDSGFDSSLALFADPYRFIARRCRAHGAPLFRTRLLLRSTVCMTGAEAAHLFYDTSRFTRREAAPEPVRATLFGKGGVQGLDGEAHRRRKQVFLDLLSPQQAGELAHVLERQWIEACGRWSAQGRFELYEQSQMLLARVACDWAGVPLTDTELRRRAHDLVALFDCAADPGLGHVRSRVARRRAERWIEGLIDAVRSGRLVVPPARALATLAAHTDAYGAALPARIAAVELLNILRPIVAISVFIVFAAHALTRYPSCSRRIRAGDDAYVEWFVQEVRRFYPFFPAVVARTRHAFTWRDYRFPSGQRVMLDLYGTNHDPERWVLPEAFEPLRFQSETPGAFDLVPQGGGEHLRNHRCPGEWITIEVMKKAVALLCRRMRYCVPEQDLSIAFERMPALPRSRFVMSDVELV